MSRVKVYFTVDTEIWPGAWDDVDRRFPEAFRRYVYGDTPHGQYALPMTLRILKDHGLQGVFFVEPLFSARFGLQPLQDIIGLIAEAGQEVQMHLHAEWADEAREPVLPTPAAHKRQHLSYYSAEEQSSLVSWGKARLVRAGAREILAFRAGSFVFNLDTLSALAASQIPIDSSYNHCNMGPQSGVLERVGSDCVPIQPLAVEDIVEYPVTVYFDRPRHLRPLQLTACALSEIKVVLLSAVEAGFDSVVIVSHNFELLDRRDFSRDPIVVRRFIGLCRFLQRNSDVFETSGFARAVPLPRLQQPPPPKGSWQGFGTRLIEQALRRL